MAAESLRGWRAEMDALLDDFGKQEYSYPLGENQLREPPADLSEAPSVLRDLYAECDGFSLPDIHVGYFADSLSRLASASRRGEPSWVSNRGRAEILVFGSDGGGGRFVVELEMGAILYLPSDGGVRDRVYEEVPQLPVRVLAPNVEAFALLLLADVRAHVMGTENHGFMV